eukprot:1723965-Amphidinium_carterae.2
MHVFERSVLACPAAHMFPFVAIPVGDAFALLLVVLCGEQSFQSSMSKDTRGPAHIVFSYFTPDSEPKPHNTNHHGR